MGSNFNKYIQQVKEQLCCNASEDYKSRYITYMYRNEQINENLEYFKYCFKSGLSPYKSLLYFNDYLNGDYLINDAEK